jgi:hypothetical protein
VPLGLFLFGGSGADGPTTVRFESGETGLPASSWLKGHFITTLKKSLLGERLPRPLSGAKMRQVSIAVPMGCANVTIGELSYADF